MPAGGSAEGRRGGTPKVPPGPEPRLWITSLSRPPASAADRIADKEVHVESFTSERLGAHRISDLTETLGYLRAMAYSLMQLARRRHLRERRRDSQWLPPSWRLLFGWTLRALLSDGAHARVPRVLSFGGSIAAALAQPVQELRGP